MGIPLETWWRKDSTLHSYVFCGFLIGLPFTVFNTYVVYQLQTVGFLIGTNVDGQPCLSTYCIVPWAGSNLDLNSIILYMNAIGFGVGGVVTLFLSAYSDFWRRKHLLVTIFIILYGVLSIPVYWLQDYTIENFEGLTALWILFAINTFIIIALLNIYIPYCMRKQGASVGATEPAGQSDVEQVKEKTKIVQRSYGFRMSILGQISTQAGSVVLLVVVIILTETLTGTASTSAGLLVTTITGFITVLGSVIAFYGLPVVPSKPSSALTRSWIEPLVEFLRPFRDLFQRKNMALLLISYTIYTDTAFAYGSVVQQLFVAEIRPGTLEFSLYSLTSVLCIIGCNILFWWIRPRLRVSLESWLIIGYALSILIPVWGLIGLSDVDFGFKMRWEFYVQIFVAQLSVAFTASAFRVVFSEMMPVGNEVRWNSLQVVLSCGTVWVNYIASGPLQNATHQLRFPLIISLIFLLVSLSIEIARKSLPVFKEDRKRWELADEAEAEQVEVVNVVGQT